MDCSPAFPPVKKKKKHKKAQQINHPGTCKYSLGFTKPILSVFKCCCFPYSSFPFKCRQWALSAWSVAIRARRMQRNRQFVVLLIPIGAATSVGINKALHRRLLPGFVFCQCCWMIDISILIFSLNCFAASFLSFFFPPPSVAFCILRGTWQFRVWVQCPCP